MRTPRSQAFAHLCLTILLAAFVIAAPARVSAQAKKVTVTMGNPGDHWLDAMQYTRVARAQRDRQFGYEVTYLVPGIGEHQLFWPRSKIDLDGSSPRRYHTQFIQLEQGRLYLPDRITAESLPKVHRAILILEGDYTKQARGGKAAAEAFATVFALAGALPARASSSVASRSSTSTASTRTTARPSAAKPAAAKPAAKPTATSTGAASTGTMTASALSKVNVRPDVVLKGGRSGQNVKNLVGPPNAAVRGAGERAFITNDKGHVIMDITRSRVKPVTPGQGFGPKRAPTRDELDILQRVLGGGS
jgi:hypothetical protein